MGQSITVESKRADGFCVFSTDRTLTGQDGARFISLEEAEASDEFAGTLAARLFTGDQAINHVYVASNDVVVGRSSDWDTASTEAAAATISELFRFYQ